MRAGRDRRQSLALPAASAGSRLLAAAILNRPPSARPRPCSGRSQSPAEDVWGGGGVARGGPARGRPGSRGCACARGGVTPVGTHGGGGPAPAGGGGVGAGLGRAPPPGFPPSLEALPCPPAFPGKLAQQPLGWRGNLGQWRPDGHWWPRNAPSLSARPHCAPSRE